MGRHENTWNFIYIEEYAYVLHTYITQLTFTMAVLYRTQPVAGNINANGN